MKEIEEKDDNKKQKSSLKLLKCFDLRQNYYKFLTIPVGPHIDKNLNIFAGVKVFA